VLTTSSRCEPGWLLAGSPSTVGVRQLDLHGRRSRVKRLGPPSGFFSEQAEAAGTESAFEYQCFNQSGCLCTTRSDGT
jgi:hypothetical protein